MPAAYCYNAIFGGSVSVVILFLSESSACFKYRYNGSVNRMQVLMKGPVAWWFCGYICCSLLLTEVYRKEGTRSGAHVSDILARSRIP